MPVEKLILQNDLQRISDWYDVNGIKLNPSTTKVVRFTSKKSVTTSNYHLESVKLEVVNEI